MLNHEFLQISHAVSYGSVTLKSLQNDNVPELDLLVREAIQNSSDAALNEDGESYSVNFTTGNFVPAELNYFLEGAEDILNKKFPASNADFLEIRDTGTSGLTGCIRLSELKDDDHGNFFKLIFDTGKKQTIASAGGNWGFGKSVYYRVGIGIVIFYSRIKTDTGFEDRLIITLIEDEGRTDEAGNDDTILNSLTERSAGKAWWGIRDGEDLLPITDMELIQSVLDVFHLKEFKNNETGTSIIIPYINTEKLLDGIIPEGAEIKDDVKNYILQVFAASIPSYLQLSIQRWYAPKIHNRDLINIDFNNKWLRVSVNNDPISKSKMFPFFKLVQELYNTALAKTNGCPYESKEFPQIETLDVNIRSYFNTGMRAGCVSVIKLSKSEINDAQSRLSPYDYAGKFEADNALNEPIIMYARDPGMIINYETSGPWVKNLLFPDAQDEYLLGFFVPETKKVIKNDYPVREYAGMPLGEYLRGCEASDHMSWVDPVKMQIVQRIQRNTVNQINLKIKPASKPDIVSSPSKLSNKLGKNLLPRLGYGKKVNPPGGSDSGSGGGGSKSNNVEFNINSMYIEGNYVKFDFSLRLKNAKKSAILSLMIASEAGWIDANSWKEEIGTEFPVKIVTCEINEVKTSVSSEPYSVNAVCDSENKIDTDVISVEILSETDKSIDTQIQVLSYIQNPEILGKIELYSYDKKYQFNFRVE